MNKIEQFFYRNAGYCWNSEKETEEQGRVRCAKQLAEAEQHAREENWSVIWDNDFDHVPSKDYTPNTCESAMLFNEDGEMLASLGCIDDADTNYRRVVEAELALEALCRATK